MITQLLHQPGPWQQGVDRASPLWRGLELWLEGRCAGQAYAFDQSGKNRHATRGTGGLITTTPLGPALSVPATRGVASYSVADAAALRSTEMTVEAVLHRLTAWQAIYESGDPGRMSAVISKAVWPAGLTDLHWWVTAGWWIGYYPTYGSPVGRLMCGFGMPVNYFLGYYFAQYDSDHAEIDPIPTARPGQTDHVALIMRADYAEFWVNGVRWTQIVFDRGYNHSTQPLVIGATSDAPDHFSGCSGMDAVVRCRVWSRALDAREVRLLARSVAQADPMLGDAGTIGSLARASQIVATPSRSLPDIGPVSAGVGDPDTSSGSFVLGWPGLTITYTPLSVAFSAPFEITANVVQDVPVTVAFVAPFEITATVGVLIPLTVDFSAPFEIIVAPPILTQNLAVAFVAPFEITATILKNQVLLHVDFEPPNFGEFPGGLEVGS